MSERVDFEKLHQFAEKRLRRKVMRDLSEGESYDAWTWSFLTEALLVAYRRSRDPIHVGVVKEAIDHAFRWRDDARGVTDDFHGRELKSWGVVRDGRWINVVTPAGRILTPTLDYIEATGDRSLLHECVTVANEMAPQFVVRGDEGLFGRPAKEDWEPLNHAVSMGRALLRLHRLTGDSQYDRMVRQLATFFKKSLILEDGDRYAWAYRPNLEDRLKGFPTPYWKADIDLSFVVDCHHANIVFDEQDIGRFVNTLKRSVLRTDFLNSRVSAEKSVPIREKAEKIGSRIYGLCGWMVLAEFDDEVEPLIEEALERHEDIMPNGWFAVPRGVWGYAFKR